MNINLEPKYHSEKDGKITIYLWMWTTSIFSSFIQKAINAKVIKIGTHE